jgi:DNA-binding TFAR19-related protein (PDSD5 family)
MMSNRELERIRRRRLNQLSKHLKAKKEEKKEKISKKDVLNRIFVGRAWEVFNATQAQYPQIARKLGDILVQLVSSGKIKRVSGSELFSLLKGLGLRVKLKTTVRIMEHGKLKSLEEKMRDNMPSP